MPSLLSASPPRSDSGNKIRKSEAKTLEELVEEDESDVEQRPFETEVCDMQRT